MATHTIGPDTAPRLDKAKHVKYWTRCLKTLLPLPYTSLDSNRLYLGYFILAALDTLDALTTASTAEERAGYADWIYQCQHREGGFRMWLGTDFGARNDAENVKWDPANVPATYFALAALLILGDDFKRVKRKETLVWVRKMQREDGSFGETLVEGRVEGGRDPRAGYCAAGIRYMLRGSREGACRIDGEEVPDIDIDSLVRCIRSAEAFDGGIADQPFHEPHAGYTFCSLGALDFVGRLRKADDQLRVDDARTGPSNPPAVIRWLAHRQTDLIDPTATLDGSHKSAKLTDSEVEAISTTATSLLQHDTEAFVELDAGCAGMNGRINKAADTCYAWWSAASLHVLGHPTMFDNAAAQKYLLEKTQHSVLGGFGKYPDDLPDLYHSYLGLAALSLVGGTDIKEVDAGMCISKEAKARLPALWRTWGVEH